ncbi:hypothetical protein SPHV1_330006 [Novosphingobium sp. KN65.2]|nr:hypothetical protein SPHV1_330006 [Novosphingobium sp. KN65.2]
MRPCRSFNDDLATQKSVIQVMAWSETKPLSHETDLAAALVSKTRSKSALCSDKSGPLRSCQALP